MKKIVYECDLCGEEIEDKCDRIELSARDWLYFEYKYVVHKKCLREFKEYIKNKKQSKDD